MLPLSDLEEAISRDVLTIPVKCEMVKDSDTQLYELNMQTAHMLEAQEPHICLATGNQPGTALYGDMGRTQSSPLHPGIPQGLSLYVLANENK